MSSQRRSLWLVVLGLAAVVGARTPELPKSAARIVENLVAATPNDAAVAVGSIRDGAGAQTHLAKHIGGALEQALVQQAGERGYRVVERAGLEELAREWALGQSGVVDEETAAAAGKLSGVSHFVFGGYVLAGGQLTLTAKLVHTETGRIVATGSGEARVDDALEELARAQPAPSIAAAAEEGAFAVELWTDRTSYRNGDTLRLHVRPSRDCYLTLIDINPHGEATIVFPNAFSRSGRFKGGLTYDIPDAAMGFDFIVEPPYGTEIVRAIVSKEPLHTLRDVMKTLGEDTPFVQPANLARLTRGIRVEGRKAAKGTWAETAVRFTIEP